MVQSMKKALKLFNTSLKAFISLALLLCSFNTYSKDSFLLDNSFPKDSCLEILKTNRVLCLWKKTEDRHSYLLYHRQACPSYECSIYEYADKIQVHSPHEGDRFIYGEQAKRDELRIMANLMLENGFRYFDRKTGEVLFEHKFNSAESVLKALDNADDLNYSDGIEGSVHGAAGGTGVLGVGVALGYIAWIIWQNVICPSMADTPEQVRRCLGMDEIGKRYPQ